MIAYVYFHLFVYLVSNAKWATFACFVFDLWRYFTISKLTMAASTINNVHP